MPFSWRKLSHDDCPSKATVCVRAVVLVMSIFQPPIMVTLEQKQFGGETIVKWKWVVKSQSLVRKFSFQTFEFISQCLSLKTSLVFGKARAVMEPKRHAELQIYELRLCDLLLKFFLNVSKENRKCFRLKHSFERVS